MTEILVEQILHSFIIRRRHSVGRAVAVCVVEQCGAGCAAASRGYLAAARYAYHAQHYQCQTHGCYACVHCVTEGSHTPVCDDATHAHERECHQTVCHTDVTTVTEKKKKTAGKTIMSAKKNSRNMLYIYMTALTIERDTQRDR